MRTVKSPCKVINLAEKLPSRRFFPFAVSLISSNRDKVSNIKYFLINSNLLVFNHFLSKALANSLQVGTIYTDMSKVFDRVNHKRLLAKVWNFGVLFSLIESYLSSYNEALKAQPNIENTIKKGLPRIVDQLKELEGAVKTELRTPQQASRPFTSARKRAASTAAKGTQTEATWRHEARSL